MTVTADTASAPDAAPIPKNATLSDTARQRAWESICTADGWENIDAVKLAGAAVAGLAWELLEQTMDTADREPSPESYRAASQTAAKMLGVTSPVEDA